MGTDSRMYMVHCMTPVHVGAGQGVGIVDMPMMREKVTEWPYFPGSSIKGVHRDFFRNGNHKQPDKWLDVAFGKGSSRGEDDAEGAERDADDGNAGALVMTDARILAFPVASHYGTFAYITCPLVLKRFKRDVEAAAITMPELNVSTLSELVQSKQDQDQSVVHSLSQLRKRDHATSKDHLYIDEFVNEAVEDPTFTAWADWLAKQLFADDHISQSMLTERIALVSDEAFQYFVTMCSEIVPRIRIDQNVKTVAEGALWNEEYLPTESILYGLIWSDPFLGQQHNMNGRKLLDELPQKTYLQIGGNATVGKGRIQCRYVKGGAL
ncbi:type III-B CRISPR module RAMP protein Cmr4 [Paenibacillus terrae]|uniref:Type III-B CRISPR module RAMP protein Cmr4 n=1 Tax=Paenibacillus terrae TaxID=159743 RepID=A0A4U2PWP3_9BACL|nr:type III-B CRISPR module RAMP protein Cmr4 [Paenibacillus terrae]TKH43947.1 type III-B CRISPR module RAMP protein Cmr4 [Paenibacillus terrae]